MNNKKSWWKQTTESFSSKIGSILRTFSVKEKMIIAGLIIIGTILVLSGLWTWGNQHMVSVSASGGRLTEGVVGSPRFINPLLAVSDTDKDLTALVYSGLLRIGSDGELIPDLAESYDISPDGLIYTFTLKPDLIWHDGKKLTARDIVFTITRAQDENTRSHKRANWEGVSVEQSGERTVIFRLNQPYAPFLENMTLGILPTHIWTNTEAGNMAFSEINTNPIGSGPYKIHKIKKDRAGVPSHYDLTSFKSFALGEPQITKLRIRFYSNENEIITALNKNSIDSAHSISPQKIDEVNMRGKTIISEALPRIFSVFFNQNQIDIFTRSEVRQALDVSMPRQKITEEVFKGYATPVFGPDLSQTEKPKEEDGLEKAIEILNDNGWSKNENGIMARGGDNPVLLSFTLNTADTPELKAIAEIIKETWEELGAQIELRVFETGALNQTVIRPRRYDALLFGTVTGRHPDPFVFWHSSQRLDPGLNISLYANITTDRLLEEIRKEGDKDRRNENLTRFLEEVRKDRPTSSIYAPKFIYVLPNTVQNASLQGMAEPSDRLTNIHEWYIKTEKVWRIFAEPNKIINN